MHQYLAILTLLFSATAISSLANEPVVAEKAVNDRTGILRFVLNKLSPQNYKRGEITSAEIIVQRSSGEVVQKLAVEVELDKPSFEIKDLNDDGYADLMLYNRCVGFAGCAGPSHAAEVFLFAPQLGRFVKSTTLSGRGEISKSTHKSCVFVNYKSGLAGYTDEEWCFNMKTGRWKMMSWSGGEPGQEKSVSYRPVNKSSLVR